ncbi:putative nucleotidyltransferase, ribonuclease H [Tanacetum coccineum]
MLVVWCWLRCGEGGCGVEGRRRWVVYGVMGMTMMSGGRVWGRWGDEAAEEPLWPAFGWSEIFSDAFYDGVLAVVLMQAWWKVNFLWPTTAKALEVLTILLMIGILASQLSFALRFGDIPLWRVVLRQLRRMTEKSGQLFRILISRTSLRDDDGILWGRVDVSRSHAQFGGMVGERILEGPEMIEVTNEKVAVAREKLKEAQTRQKSYADRHRRALEFQPGEHVFLKVSPTRGVRRFGIKGKLSPRFIGPFEILDRVGEVSYRLALPPQLSHVHNVFHVSLLRGYKYHPLHVVSYPFDQIREDLSYTEEPESILDRQDRVMRNKTIPFVKILWRNHPEREATWETEESIRTSYPHFLP